MEATSDIATLLQRAGTGFEFLAELKKTAFADSEAVNRFRAILAELEHRAAASAAEASANAVALGLSHLLLGDPARAAEWLGRAPAGLMRSFLLGETCMELGRFRDAAAAFEEAARQGADRLQCDCRRALALLGLGESAQAEALIDSHSAAGQRSADWHFARGRVFQEAGHPTRAAEHYEKALAIDENHAHAIFHLAYVHDLYGNDESARELYQACCELPYVPIHALINLAVLYEDAQEYEAAAACLRRVLSVQPNHPRAQLYLKDVLAARHMYIDEHQLKSAEKRNAVLDIPVTDFELSVRSRNCLKKMNINTLGDLLRITEEELLSYRNFGETSLKEIKAMLAQKGLVLGQLAGTAAEPPAAPALPDGRLANVSTEVLSRPVATLELSVRARKCLQHLGVTTIGDLARRSEAELLASRNFGQTSLNEIKERLGELGLSLRAGD